MIEMDMRAKANESSIHNDDSDRRTFVSNLGWLLSQTRTGVKSCSMDETGKYVVITYENDYQRKVFVEADSYGAIITDVMKRVW